MYKKSLFLFVFLNFFRALAQPLDTANISIYYSLSHARDTMFLDKFTNENFVLHIGKTMSVYITMDQAAEDSARNAVMEKARINFERTGQMNVNMAGVKTATGTLIYKNALTNTFTFVDPFMSIYYLIESPTMPVINWTITEETKQVQTLTCQKATAKFRGRDYEAWFCSAIPYNNGPWKFGGLPGLIVEVYDTKRQVFFSLNRIENNKNEIVLIRYPEKYQKVTAKEYMQLREGVRSNPSAFFNGQMSSSSGGTFSIKKVGNSGRNIFNNPIELSKD